MFVCQNCLRRLRSVRSTRNLEDTEIASFVSHSENCELCNVNRLTPHIYIVKESKKEVFCGMKDIVVIAKEHGYSHMTHKENNVFVLHIMINNICSTKVQLNVSKSFEWELYIYGHRIDDAPSYLDSPRQLLSKQTISEVFLKVSKIKLCPGNTGFIELIKNRTHDITASCGTIVGRNNEV